MREAGEILNLYSLPEEPKILIRVRNVARTGEEILIAFLFEMWSVRGQFDWHSAGPKFEFISGAMAAPAAYLNATSYSAV
jgi:hypothetical protein